jgi:hypothetical protein
MHDRFRALRALNDWLILRRLHGDAVEDGGKAVKAGLSPGPALLTFALLSAATGVLAADTVYRWLDDRGNLMISDRPPEDSSITYEAMRMGESAMSRTFRRNPDPEPEADSPSREEAAAEPETPVARVERPEKDPELCRQARENLDALDTFTRIRTKDENGEYYYLTEEDKEFQREQARETIRIHCN